jgi:hypothetical protein
MMRCMREARSRLRTLAAVIAALLVLLVALTPTLLFGEPLSALGLILIGGSLLGAGLLVRLGRDGGAWALGTSLVIIGGVILSSA